MNRPSRSEPAPDSSLRFPVLHLLLALLWMALMGWGGVQLVVGLVIGLVALAVSARLVGGATYLRALVAAVALIGVFVAVLVTANLQLARDILRRRPRFNPAILAFDLGTLGRLPTALLVSLVSLTPGTLVVDLAVSEKTLFVHTLYAQDEQKARREVERYMVLLRALSSAPGAREEAP
jgi:multicomponent Na+:H+ antiporter subunit E